MYTGQRKLETKGQKNQIKFKKVKSAEGYWLDLGYVDHSWKLLHFRLPFSNAPTYYCQYCAKVSKTNYSFNGTSVQLKSILHTQKEQQVFVLQTLASVAEIS